ncbi:MAG TPA: error-prone DNA polymerase [Solirubrobacterales bacterium]|nr:error-prone DNA polymerase [Solirubrobacterales bacterium]
MDADSPYVELHAHSAFSFLDGASTPTELAATAAELGYEAMALTDHDGVWGSMEFAKACEGFGVRAITGAEVTVALPAGELAHLTLLVETPAGYRNLCRLLTAAHSHTRDGAQRSAGQPSVGLEQVEGHVDGLVCLSGCAREGAVAGAWERGDPARGAELARRLHTAFGRDRFRVELQRPYERRDRARNRWLDDLAARLGVPCVATGNVHYHRRSRSQLQDALVAVRHGVGLDESEPLRRGNSTAALVSHEGIARRFAEYPGAVAETARLAERLRFDLTAELGYSYPGAEDEGADRELAEVCRVLLTDRYAGRPDLTEAENRLEEELATIRGLGLSGFFLLHCDLLELAREVAVQVRGASAVRAKLPPGRGRGSSVSSIVCYLTGLSHIDPVESKLFAGRFLNDELDAVPDIDLDFPRDIREKLIPEVHRRYGAERSALVAAFPTYRPRGVVRDLGKALGLPPGEIERVTGMVGFHERKGEIEKDVIAAIGLERAASPRWRALIGLCGEAMGLPRHVSQHPGGMVISTKPLVDVCPVVPAAMEGRRVVQWDKDSCGDAGFLKIDLLGLGMLSAVERCVVEIERARGEQVDLSRIRLDDSDTYRSIHAAETTGVFQIESRAQMQMLPRTLPQNLDDLTVQVALVRPGPIQGGAVHPYIERRKRRREDPAYEVPYEHPLLEPVLEDTLGTIVFQEQVIEVAMKLAGFSSSEAEGLRRAMSRKRSEEAIRSYHDDFVAGAEKRGVSTETAESVWGQIQGFSGFGFPKAHSAAFGLLAYQSAWLREHYAPEFLCSLLNEQPMGFYPPDALTHEAQRRGVRIAPPAVNGSDVRCQVERERGGLVVRIGLGYVKGVREEEMEALVAERERSGPYRTIAELSSRSGAGREGLELLAWAGALDGLALGAGEAGVSRRESYWGLGVAGAGQGAAKSRQLPLPLDPPPAPELERMSAWEEVIEDYRSTGINLGRHPLSLLRDGLGEGVMPSSALARVGDGATVEVAGMVVARQRPQTAKGIVFMLLEDERGTVNLIVPPPVYERRRAVVRTAPLLRARGRLERREGVVNLLVADLAPIEWSGPAKDTEVRPIEPRPRSAQQSTRAQAVAELRAVAPTGHSWGRRG